MQRTVSIDEGWRFLKDNPSGAEDPAFDDTNWRIIDLHHDWSIEDMPGQGSESVIGPFTKSAIHKMSIGYAVGGTAWYRKSFTINKEDLDKIVWLQFDGVYMNSYVWVNGKHVGNHPYGYTSFYYDITGYLNPTGETNTIAVQVKNEGKNTRWYSGSGIYSNTWLTLANPVHIGVWGVYITTPEVSGKDDLTSILLRDRTHPSVIMWSIGNEIMEAPDTSGLRIAGQLAAEVRRLDPTRAVTEAMVDFGSFAGYNTGWDKQTPHMNLLYVIGYNYGFNKYQEDHKKYPERIISASESMPPLSFQNWQANEELPYVFGNFTCTAMDYLGEAGKILLIARAEGLKEAAAEIVTES